jgi:pimeloyl-ACP methyl ester carboxylesterase
MPSVLHRTVAVDGVEIFYRETGPPGAAVLLLPHGYPSSSFQYRALMPALGDQWRVLAPDFPGFGYSAAPDDFEYTFANYATLLQRFLDTLGVDRFVLYLFDYGSQVGFQLALRDPARIAGLIIQNGDAYEETLGPKYAALKEYWADPTDERRAALAEAVSFDGSGRRHSARCRRTRPSGSVRTCGSSPGRWCRTAATSCPASSWRSSRACGSTRRTTRTCGSGSRRH